MSLQTTPNVKSSHILTEKYFIFLTKCPSQNLKVSIPNFDIHELFEKLGKS